MARRRGRERGGVVLRVLPECLGRSDWRLLLVCLVSLFYIFLLLEGGVTWKESSLGILVGFCCILVC